MTQYSTGHPFPIYLDYMATTPVDPRVKEKMLGYLDPAGCFGNPASQGHRYGVEAAEAVEAARRQVAEGVGADSREIVWTSGATEANNLAIKGAAYFYRHKGAHIVTCKTEHPAVLDPCRYLASQGFCVTFLSPQPNGLMAPETLRAAMRDETVLVSLMHVNNEIGVIQDLRALGEIVKARGALFHVDAAQALGKVPIDLRVLPVDLMSFSAHKVYGPKGIGALYVRRTPRVRLVPQIHGGGQEQGLRSGTLPTHQIVGMGEACRIAALEMAAEQHRLFGLRERLWHGIRGLGGIFLNGDEDRRVAGNLNVSVEDVEGEALLLGLRDLAVSSGSACTSATIEPSHVLKALGVEDELAHSAIRLSLGRFTTEAEIDHAILHFKEVVRRLRALAV